MIVEPLCKTCRFWLRMAPSRGVVMGFCRVVSGSPVRTKYTFSCGGHQPRDRDRGLLSAAAFDDVGGLSPSMSDCVGREVDVSSLTTGGSSGPPLSGRSALFG